MHDLRHLPDPLPIEPIDGPLDADVQVPGSKSITNRALVCAALADGRSRLRNALGADDVDAMVGILGSLGVEVRHDGGDLLVDGVDGRPAPSATPLDARQSGTTSRFVAPLLLLGSGTYELTAHPQMRARPMGGTFDALEGLGAVVECTGEVERLPARITVGDRRGGAVVVPGDVSSQFLSGLLLAGPCFEAGLRIDVTTELVSKPYVDLTVAVMESFGAVVRRPNSRTFLVEPTGYRAGDHPIEPDASAASYPLAAAAVCGGRVRVTGLGEGSLQGDVRFADVLARMGADVRLDGDGIEVRAERGTLRGGTFSFADISDTAPTIACVAPFVTEPVTITDVAFMRHKEIDRIAAVTDALRRCGIEVVEHDDGWTITPGTPRPAVLPTHEDHRMAMSFSLLGLGAPGIEIAGPDCVAKTFPRYWDLLIDLRPGPAPAHGRS